MTGLNNPELNRYLQPLTADEQWMCTNQIVQRDGYSNFSVVGLVTILVVGGLALVLSKVLPKTWPCVRRLTAHNVYRDQLWKDCDILELQLPTRTTDTEPANEEKRINMRSFVNGVKSRVLRMPKNPRENTHTAANATALPRGCSKNRSNQQLTAPSIACPSTPEEMTPQSTNFSFDTSTKEWTTTKSDNA